MEGSELRFGVPSGEPEASREVRWSARREEQVVLRLLRGESLDLLARETGQPAGQIVGWREEFLAAGREGPEVAAGAGERPTPARCAPTAQVRKRAARLHEGTTTVDVPDTLWATDATEAWTRQGGRCAVFVLVDHASNEVWYDAARRMDRFAAADLLREVCSERFGSVERAVAAGLALRYDGGSCFRSDHYQAEIDHLDIARSLAFHYEPETNGCAEKAIQVLKEQLLWIERFDTLEELRTAVRAFGRTYNEQWLIERHAYRTPVEAREHPRAQAAPRHAQPVRHGVWRTGAGGRAMVALCEHTENGS